MLPEQIRLRDHSTVFCFIRLLGNNESYAVATHILSQPGIVFSLLLADPRLPTTHYIYDVRIMEKFRCLYLIIVILSMGEEKKKMLD